MLPIMFALVTLAFELGNLSITESKYENEIKNTITYGLKHLDNSDIKNKLEKLLDINLDGEKTVEVSNNSIKIHVYKKLDTIFGKVLKNKFTIDITYTGELENGKIKLTKE